MDDAVENGGNRSSGNNQHDGMTMQTISTGEPSALFSLSLGPLSTTKDMVSAKVVMGLLVAC
jgi:hypothetical protein